MAKCLYHASDLDGKMSAAIVDKFVKDCELIPVNYGDVFPWHLFINDAHDPNEMVYMVDFSLQPFEKMKDLALHCNLVWIDHHITAIKAASEAGPWNRYLHDMSLREGIGACQTVWQYFSTDAVPLAVRLLAHYDVWDHDWVCNETAKGDVLNFEYGVMANEPASQPALMKFLKDLCLARTREPLIDYINEGKAALKYIKATNREYVEMHAKPVTFEGYNCIAVNKGLSSSLLFESIKEPYDIKIAYCRLPNGVWTVHMYSSATLGSVHVGNVAKRYGGGGHAGAAGFQCENLPFEI